MQLNFRNINDGFRGVVSGLADGSIPSEPASSRNGPVLRVTEPVLLRFDRPTERVLLNAARDANPFSILYEALWTLSGRNDVKPISYYTKRMGEFSDDGVTWHGAYGYRWRHHFGYDQLDHAVDTLRGDATSRRVILEMWDARVDGRGSGKDYPCNTHVYVTVRGGKLNLTVCNRSNDTCWGLFGTNYVLFSFLQEYLASRVGVPVGIYYHMSNDLHVYESNWKPDEWLAAEPHGEEMGTYGYSCPVSGYKTVPLVKDPAAFEQQLPFIVSMYDGSDRKTLCTAFTEPFLLDVAEPMFMAFRNHKSGEKSGALEWASKVKADDWRLAAEGWLNRRAK